nr:MFS transporter [Parafrankia sp. EUN1f]
MVRQRLVGPNVRRATKLPLAEAAFDVFLGIRGVELLGELGHALRRCQGQGRGHPPRPLNGAQIKTRPAVAEHPPGPVTAVLAIAGMLAALQQTMVVPLVHELPTILGVSPTSAAWAVTATLLSGAIATPIISRLADMVGKRRMVVIALVTSTSGSLLVALSGGSFALVLLGRTCQGFAAALIPVGISVMRDVLPKERVGFAVALMSATLGIGGALGLSLSGVLYGHLGFASIFWAAALLGVVLTVAVLLLVPESLVRTPGRFDRTGAVLVSVTLASLLLAVSKGNEWGWSSAVVLGLLGVAGLTLAVWIPFELRVGAPMVDLRTAARKPVLLTNAASLCVAFPLYINMLASSQQLQEPTATGYGFALSVTEAGLAMMPSGLILVLLSPLSGRLVTRVGGRGTLLLGAGIMAAAYVLRVFLTGSVTEVVVGASLVSVGTALSFAAMPTLIMAHVPITESASANGLNSLMRALGGAVSSAFLASVLASMTIVSAGTTVPSLEAFRLVYWIAAGVALMAFGLAALIPRRLDEVRSTGVSGAGEEMVVRGRVLAGGGALAPRAAVVTVTGLGGEPVDWARTDNNGRYSVAVPGPGRYLLVTNSRGWAPHAEIVDLVEDDDPLQVVLDRELALTGYVVCGGVPVGRATVVLHTGLGEFKAATSTDANGHFTFHLPPSGPYLLTAVVEGGRSAGTVKTVIGYLAEDVTIEVSASGVGRPAE